MTFERIPESELVMEQREAVVAFDDAGVASGPLAAIYEFSSLALSRMLPHMAVVVDLGCGPGRFLGNLLSRRPDVQGIGVDLSDEMLDAARRAHAERSIGERVRYVQADFASFDECVPGHVDAIVCMSALHHCADFEALVATLAATKRVHERTDCAIWFFDLVRPEHEDLCELIPRAHEVAARERLAPAFRTDWVNSLKAGWSVSELRAALDTVDLDLAGSSENYSQVYWSGVARPDGHKYWNNELSPRADVEKAYAMAISLGFDGTDVLEQR